MTRRPAFFTQGDIVRAIRAAETAGMRVGRIDINPDGGITVVAASEVAPPPVSDIEAWKARRDARRA
jgi:hypothetical protein